VFWAMTSGKTVRSMEGLKDALRSLPLAFIFVETEMADSVKKHLCIRIFKYTKKHSHYSCICVLVNAPQNLGQCNY
jgi:hypothetical protein